MLETLLVESPKLSSNESVEYLNGCQLKVTSDPVSDRAKFSNEIIRKFPLDVFIFLKMLQ